MSTSLLRADYSAQQKLVSALLGHERISPALGNVQLLETHISWVLLSGRYAYKIKKALNLGFLDFTTLEARKFYCGEEIKLNCRLASAIYLNVISIGGNPDLPEFGTQPAIEYAVKMRRFPVDKQLNNLLVQGKLKPQHLDHLAALLADFHGQLSGDIPDKTFGAPDTILNAANQNFVQLQSVLTAPADQLMLKKLKLSTQELYSTCDRHFIQRREQGYVRECHGDLHLGNIVLIGKIPTPFDGIEFNPALRWIDVIDEISFLVMDLLHTRHADLAYRFLNSYLEATGDYAGISVLRFYLAYRAGVRAKVSALQAFQPGHTKLEQAQAVSNSQSYLTLADECLTRNHPALIITHGLPGSGKSTFALAAAEHLQAIRIRSDVERKRLFGIAPLDDSNSQTDSNIYSAEATHLTYQHLHKLAQTILKAGFPVIVDAAFLQHEERERFRILALNLSVPFAIASIQASNATLRSRIQQRYQAGTDPSEADLGVLHTLQSAQQALLPHEVERTAQFLNERNRNSSFVKTASWNRLKALIED
jgi:aminoglycoside phosphotransferase family enzyme/predicted kinase